MKNATPRAHKTDSCCTFNTATCVCSDCMSARLPVTCPPGCPCLVCLVESLEGPAPKRAA